MTKRITANEVLNSRYLVRDSMERYECLDAEFNGVVFYVPEKAEYVVLSESDQTVYLLDARDDMFGDEISSKPFSYYVR